MAPKGPWEPRGGHETGRHGVEAVADVDSDVDVEEVEDLGDLGDGDSFRVLLRVPATSVDTFAASHGFVGLEVHLNAEFVRLHNKLVLQVVEAGT